MKPEVDIRNYGTSPENPILVSSIRAGYNYCDKLRNINEDLEYTRRGRNSVPGFEKPVDAYDLSASEGISVLSISMPTIPKILKKCPNLFLPLTKTLLFWMISWRSWRSLKLKRMVEIRKNYWRPCSMMNRGIRLLKRNFSVT